MEIKEKFEEVKENVKEKVENVTDWMSKHKEICMIGLPIAAKAVSNVFVEVSKNARSRSIMRYNDTSFYDYSVQHHVRSKRPLTRKEMLEFDYRRSKKEPASMILNDMGLLK